MQHAVTFWSISVLILSTLCSSFALSQISIKETIPISPASSAIVRSTTSSGSHTLKFEATMDVPIFTRVFTTRRFNDYGQCSSRQDTGTGGISFEIPLSAGKYYFDFQPCVAELFNHQVCTVTLTVRVDGQVALQTSSPFEGGTYAVYALWPGGPPMYASPYNTTFAFDIGDSVLYEEGSYPWVEGVSTCEEGTWDPGSTVHLQITEGSAYAQFFNFNTWTPLGNTVDGTASQIQENYKLAADGAMPDSCGAYVTVVATSGGITRTAVLKIEPYFFRVWTDSLRLDYGTGTAIRVQMVDVEGDEYYRQVIPFVRIRIADSLRHGTLWYGRPDSTRVWQMSDTLVNIGSALTTSHNSSVEARFYANEEQPKDSVRVTIAVEKTGEGFSYDPIPRYRLPFPGRDTVRGAMQVTVVTPVKKTLKIVDHSPWEIWPDLKGSASGVTGYEPKRGFVVLVSDESGNAVTGDSVIFKTSFEAFSGGHNHNTPALPPKLQGSFAAKPWKDNPLVLATDDSGKIVIESFAASEVSGKYIVTASLVADSTVRDTVNLQVRVPGLLLFSGNGQYDTTGSVDLHPRNHYFSSQTAIDSLIAASNAFKKQKWNTTGRMRLNDMSLPWGGLFDLNAQWTNAKGHNSHRIGKSVDIENLEMVEIDTVSIYTQKDTTLSIPKVKWVENFQYLLETEMRQWKFVNEHQAEADVFKRTRKYPHFEWKGK